MARAIKRPCRTRGCPSATNDKTGYCPGHQHEASAQRNRRIDERRGTAAQRGYGSRWKKARATYLQSHPLCTHCRRDGRTEAATVVDHIKPHRGDQALFWDRDNWQPLCKRCHDTKTAREDGGFGRG